MTRRHLVIVTYGEPPSPAFVEQLVYSWRILQGLTRSIANIPRPAIPFIAWSRARGRRRLWQEYAYSSPLELITGAQADAARTALAAQPAGSWSVHVAYEFRQPLLNGVLRGIPGNEPVWVAPMYAADSAFTHELSRQSARSAVQQSRRSAPVRVLPALDVEQLADISARHVLREAGETGTGRETALVLAAHGTLLEPARSIDTGRCATERLYGAVRQRLSSRFGLILNGWLNHTRGGRWTEPPIEEALARVADAGFTEAVYYPFGFLADNAESQLEGRLAAATRPGLRLRFLPCLNDSVSLVKALVEQALA